MLLRTASYGFPHSSRLPRATLRRKIGRPKEKGGPRLGKCRQRLGTVMSGDSMTANHVEHGIATFPGSVTCRRGAECNVAGWADGETGDCKGLTCPTQAPSS